jgi:hypothetical protein
MTVLIYDIGTYLDGGTIGISCYINSIPKNIKKSPGVEPTITIDYSISSKRNGTEGGWYFGWKNKGGELIEDEEIKDEVKRAIQEHIDRLTILFQNRIL